MSETTKQAATGRTGDGQPKHARTLPLIRTAKGHLNGIEQMVEDNRYCIDISNQLQAVIAILRKADAEILRTHLETCVKESLTSGDLDHKLKELESVIDHLVGEK